MTAGSGMPEDSAADRLAGLLFDSEVDACELGESAADAGVSMDERQIRRVADLHLVHSLMLQVSSCDQTVRERRIDRVLKCIRHESGVSSERQRAVPHRPHSMFGTLVRYGVAAMLVISATILLTQMPSSNAMAAMDKIITAMDRAGDRTYRIIVRDSRVGRRERRNDRYSDVREPQRNRATLDGAMLYLRGNDKFVLYRPTPSGNTVVNGCDGQTRWLIRPKRPVLVSSGPQAFRIPMPEELAELLTLDFRATLVQIRDNYAVKYLDDGTVDHGEDLPWMYLSARKQNRNFKGPKNIRIWADTESGVLQRIEFVEIRLQGHAELKKLIIELVGENALPENWFTHESHHPSGVEIEFLGDNASGQAP